MGVTILYRPESEHERAVLDFQRELLRERVTIKLMNVDSPDGSYLARLYDITRYPGVLVTEEDGRVLKSWVGELPQVSEVTYTANV